MKTLLVNSKASVKTFLKILIGAIIIGVAFLAVGYFANLTTSQNLTIGEKKIKVEVVKTEADVAKGLSGRKGLAENAGMLFVYDGEYLPKFWMKEMKFPIDIIWIKNGMVTGFEKDIPVSTQDPLPTYQPKDFINAVLEVNAGFVEENGIKIGDRVAWH